MKMSMVRAGAGRTVSCGLWASLMALSSGPLLAQAVGPEIQLSTGGGVPLVQQTFEMPAIPSSGNGENVFSFQIGFTTAETFQAGQLFDAFTLYLEDSALTKLAVPLTLDAAGAHWAPATPGGLSLADGSLIRVPVSWGGSAPAQANTVAYDVSFALPEALQQQPLRVTVSLFDNQNAAGSAGYFRVTTVPEPGPVALLLLGAVPLWWLRKSRR